MQGFSGIVWHMIPAGANPLAPAAAPEGRFHHSGQPALYASLTAEGTIVAMQRYLVEGGRPRLIVPLTIRAARLADQRGNPAASVVWQDVRASGDPAPTWAFSDEARGAGAEGMFYSSRSRPDLSHLVVFDLTVILSAGAAMPSP
jgi:RES domain-containing protein